MTVILERLVYTGLPSVRGLRMKILFQYHQVQRTQAHEDMIRSRLATVLMHAPQITNVIIHTELDHGKIERLRLEAHMPPHKNFCGETIVEPGITMEHAAVLLILKALRRFT